MEQLRVYFAYRRNTSYCTRGTRSTYYIILPVETVSSFVEMITKYTVVGYVQIQICVSVVFFLNTFLFIEVFSVVLLTL